MSQKHKCDNSDNSVDSDDGECKTVMSLKSVIKNEMSLKTKCD